MHPIRISSESQHLAREGVIGSDLYDLYPIDLRGRPDDNCMRFHGEYINMWNNRSVIDTYARADTHTHTTPWLTFVPSILHTHAVDIFDHNDADDNVAHLPNHLFLDQMMRDGNQGALDSNQLWTNAKKRRGLHHNLYQRLNQEGIRLATIDHPGLHRRMTVPESKSDRELGADAICPE
ncbi:hypothetical protein Goari_003014 [Gossypium aridum]|uniref:Uncharacterized protein n=1 Tax=Gossypium aridum TaxID=34290 RepID=A0A7J8YBP2_GOSAI|nr:hypothetical protein [Gossypium aridum]